jgi:hypothetical protein
LTAQLWNEGKVDCHKCAEMWPKTLLIHFTHLIIFPYILNSGKDNSVWLGKFIIFGGDAQE